MSDQQITCSECGGTFVFTEAEQQFYDSKGLASPPRRCKACRMARRAAQAGGGGAGGGYGRGPSNGGGFGRPRRDSRDGGDAGGFRGGYGPPRGGDRDGASAPRRPRPERGAAGPGGGGGGQGGYGRPRFGDRASGGATGHGAGGASGGFGGGFGRDRGGPPREPRDGARGEYRAPAFRDRDPRDTWGTRGGGAAGGAPRPERSHGEHAPHGAGAGEGHAPRPRPNAPRAGAKEERKKFDITCASCGAHAQVPFKPLEGRQVFCQPCYRARKGVAPAPDAVTTEPDRSSAATDGDDALAPEIAASADSGIVE